MASRDWRPGWPAGLSVLLGVAVAVLVNVWTGDWAWPAGTGLAVLALSWAVVEVARTGGEGIKSGMRVRQQAASLRRSKLVGYEGRAPGSQPVDVEQVLGTVEEASIVGITETPGEEGSTWHGGGQGPASQ
jgi:hypothetical protein